MLQLFSQSYFATLLKSLALTLRLLSLTGNTMQDAGQQIAGHLLCPGTVPFIFLYFTPCLTFSLRLMVTHRLDSCDHLLYRLVTWYVLVSLLLS